MFRVRMNNEVIFSGPIINQIDCPPLVRSYLCASHHIHQVLWARLPAANRQQLAELTSPQNCRRLLAPGQSRFRLFIDCLPDAGTSMSRNSSSSSSSNRQSQSAEILEYNGTMSQYSRSNEITTSRVSVESKDLLGAVRNV
jgi:hypothetical protein